MRQVIRNAACTLPLKSPMKRQTDLVYHVSVDTQGTHTPRHHSPCIYLTARRTDDHPLTMLNLPLCCQFGADFGKEFRLERIQPGHPARHRTAHMVFGQTIGRNHNRVRFIPYRSEKIIRAVAEVFRGRITLLSIQGIVNG